MLNNIYSANQLSDFRLGARAQAAAYLIGVENSAVSDVDIEIDEPPAIEETSSPTEPLIYERLIQ